ncbi:NAD(P)H-quinone oxidoreductase subunit I, chloroplastic [Ensifer psoraleae]|uniref:ferredoxin-type protein NapF n=1 Tax=Sinorhizobium psoraleae TaxID=520838 RepID=UPI00156A2E1D|nr:ferredoxin-type protein NapF [Sinorhizobium psoraleae]NRP72732.1 NAD(P)H-quinone oxidoreductase subunit I, chloroplastic [Sinorhizobium psoraleae]
MAVTTISRRNLLFGRGASEPERICPPGVTLESLAACTGCGRCVDACPPRIISLAADRPSLDFSVGECTFCGDCRRACPEPVFQSADVTRFAHVAAIADHCLAKNNVACQSCRDSCPEEAIRFQPRTGGPFLPIVNENACSGCGACVGICPVGAVQVAARNREGAHA